MGKSYFAGLLIPLTTALSAFGTLADAQTSAGPVTDLSIATTVDTSTPREGDTIAYAVELTNRGGVPVTNVQVNHLLPEGLKFVSGSATGGTYVGRTGVWGVSRLDAGATEILTVTARVEPGTAGSTIVGVAGIAFADQPDDDPANDSARIELAPLRADRTESPFGEDGIVLRGGNADLGVTKTVDVPIPPVGGTIHYTVILSNNGPDTATGIQVNDLLPAGVTFVSSSVTQGTYIAGSGIWVLSSLPNADADTLTITATVNSGTAATTIVNTATVAASDQNDNNSANNSASAPITVQGADLEITKTVNNSAPNEGQSVTFTVVLDNNGPSNATNVQVTDLLPSGVTFVSRTLTQGTYSSGTGLWAVGNVANGASATLTLTATVNAGTGGSTIVNTASVTGSSQGDAITANNSDPASITVQLLDLAVTKTVDDDFPNEGDTIQYTVVVTNNGPDAGTNVKVTDPLPSGLSFVSSSATQGSYSSGTGLWTVGTVANAASATLTLTATVNGGTGASTIVNTATVDSDQADHVGSNDSDSASLTVQSVDLAVTKTVDDSTPSEGQTIDYTVVLANAGPDAATNVTVTDALPSGVTFVSSVATQGTYSSGTGQWTLANLPAADADTLTITATVDFSTAGLTIGNTATLTASDQADSNPPNDSDSVDIIVQDADLAVTKTVDDGFPNEGDTIQYTVVVTNNGPDGTTNVDVTDVLPVGVTFVSSSATQGTYSSGTGIWSLPSLASAAADTLVITATIDAGTGGDTIVNTANVTDSDQGDSNNANNIDSVSLTVQSVDLRVVKTVNDPAPNEGGTITYKVALSNIGTDTATGVVVTDLLPAGVTFVSAVTTQGSYSSGTGLWTVGSQAPAEADTLTINASVDAGTNGTTIVNTATVTASDQADANPANDSDPASITVQRADLGVTKTVNNDFPNEGATIQYGVVLTNSGPNTATNIQVTDVLPAGVTFVSASATNGTYSSGTGIWSMGSLANGGSATLTITATVNAGTNGSTIVNTATITASDQGENNPANDSDSASLTVQSIDLAVTKTVDDPAPNEGDTIQYSVSLVNNGPHTATNVKLTDLLPAGLTFVSSAPSQGGYVSGTGLWTVGTIANAGGATLTLTATVNAGTGATTIVNTATVTDSDQTDSNSANDSDSASLTVQSVDLAVTKTVDDSTPSEGDTIAYTVVLANAGPDAGTNVQVTDVLPAGVTFVSSVATEGAYASGTGLWSLASIPGATADTLTITVTVDAGTGGTSISNTATLTDSDQADSNGANDSDSVGITVQAADLAVTKNVNDSGPPEGGTINYTVVVTNNGPDATTNVQVTDQLPAGVTFSSNVATQGSYNSGTGVWTVGTLANAASATLTITATVNANTGGTTIVNTANVTASDQPDNTPANDSDSASITVEGVDLAVTKTVDDPAPVEGGTIQYTVVLTNNGPDTATNIQVNDALPAGVTFVSSAVTDGVYISGSGVWILGSVPAATADTLVITATVNVGTTGSTITNTASVAFVDQSDGNPANDSDSVDINPQGGADLAVVKTVDNPAPGEGDTIVFTVVLTNNGPFTTTGVDVTDLLPAGVTFVSSTQTQGTYTSGTGIWSLASIAVADPDTLAITATVNNGTIGQTIVNTASVTASGQSDGNAGNNSDTASITVTAADLAVAKSVDDPSPNEGGTVVYTVALTNNGPHTATSVQLTDLLPAGVTFVSGTVTQGSYVSGTGVWSVGTVTNAEADTLTITATVDSGTIGQTIVNTASVAASDQADGVPGNDSDSASITVSGGADLAVTKMVDDPTPPQGGTINYTIVIANLGTDATTNVAVTDVLPAGLTFVSSSATQGTYVSGTGVWSVGSMANADSDTLTITATVNVGTAGQTIDNTATVTASDEPDPNPANDSATASITVLTAASETQITNVGTDARPNWAPSGIVVAFDSDRSGNRDIWRVPFTGGTATQVTTDATVDQDPDWSPDGTQIAYRHGSPDTDIWLIPASGGAGAPLHVDPANADRFPAWSPDGTQIAYEKGGDIYVIASSGGTPLQITTDPGVDAHPTWSPDGTQIAFISNRSGNNDIWKMPSSGGTATQVTSTGANEGAPDWSADGTQIAFQSNTAGNNDIWVIPASGGTATQITTGAGNDAQPDWSPSGTRIAFARIGVGIFIYSFPSTGADLEVAKSVDTPFPNEGDTVVYTVVLTNNSLASAAGVAVTDFLPAGVTFVSSTATQGTFNSGTGVWAVGLVASSSSETLTITVTVSAGTGGQTLSNIASITASDQPDPVSSNNVDSADITVQSADLAIVKTVDNPAPGEGTPITYTVVLTNNGPFTGIGIQVTDILPTGVTFASATTTQGAYNNGTSLWTVGNMVASTADTLSITATVDAGTNGMTITNTASVTAVDQADPVPGNNSDSADITVQTSTGTPLLASLPTSYALGLSHPNPFRQATTIPFDLPVSGTASVSIWDVSGRLVRTVAKGEMAAGRYQPRWDGRDDAGRTVASGIYFVRFESGAFADTRKIIRVR